MRRYSRPYRSTRRPRAGVRTLVLPPPWLLAGVVALIVALVLVVSGCGGDGGEANGGNAQAARGKKGAWGGRQAPSQPPVPVAIDAAKLGSIASYYTATATLTAEKEASILARANGVIVSLACEEGDWVERGQALLKIEDDEYRLRLEQAEANTASLKDRHNRLEGMWQQQLVSAEEYEQAKNDLKAAEAEEGLARLNLSYTSVVAPFTGRVVERLIDPGQTVNVGTPLFRIADFRPLLAVVHVPAREFRKLKPDQPVHIVLDSNSERLDGRIKLVSPTIDPNSGTIKVTVEIPSYPGGTRPGDFAEVRIVTETRNNATLVPKIAVFTDRGDQVVYVAADSTAERRVVEVGFEDDRNAEIVNGVTAGEPVVVKGQRSLKHGSPIKVLSDQPGATAASRNQRAGS